MSAPVELPPDLVDRVRTMCTALPEVTVRRAGYAQSYDIRRRSFCLLLGQEDERGGHVSLLVLRANPDEREVLLAIGHPYLPTRAGNDRVMVVLTEHTDWDEIRELVVESYRMLAPKKLIALLDGDQIPRI